MKESPTSHFAAVSEKEASIARPARLTRSLLFLLVCAVWLTGVLGCAGSAWNNAQLEDSASSYHRFLRDYPDSEFARAAHERIDYLKLQRAPTLANFREFEEKHPNSRMPESLRAPLQRVTFNAARSLGTAAAYEGVAREFPNGEYAARATGNAVYLRDIGPRAGAAELRAFADEHPESDFSREAKRSADSVAHRLNLPDFQSIGLVLQLAESTPEMKRVAASFQHHAKESYAHAPIRLVFLSSRDQVKSSGVDALIVLRHSEEAVASGLTNGVITKPGVQIRTEVELSVRGDVIWSRPFEMRVESREHVKGTSVLFSSAGPRFWGDFFLPVATWPSHVAVRAPVAMGERVVAVDTSGDRAVVLSENGNFEILQMADPEAPVKLGAYKRKTQLEHFDGVRLIGGRIAIFGTDGLEVIGGAGGKTAPIAAWTRGQVGTLSSLEAVGDQLLIGSNKGLLLAPMDLSSSPKRLLRRNVHAMTRSGEVILVADDEMLLLSTVRLLSQNRLLGQVRIGRDFAVQGIRAFGSTAFVIGKGGVIVLDISIPRAPRMVARLLPNRVGRVDDVARVGKEFFLAGERGVQVLAASLDRVVETVDTLQAQQLASLGRHVIAVGGEQVQVVDALPFGAKGKRDVAKAR